jgi:hypothetical protein
MEGQVQGHGTVSSSPSDTPRLLDSNPFPRDRAQQDRNKGEIATSHAPNNGGGLGRIASVRDFRLAPRKRGEADARSAAGEGSGARARACPSP